MRTNESTTDNLARILTPQVMEVRTFSNPDFALNTLSDQESRQKITGTQTNYVSKEPLINAEFNTIQDYATKRKSQANERKLHMKVKMSTTEALKQH